MIYLTANKIDVYTYKSQDHYLLNSDSNLSKGSYSYNTV